MHVMISNEHEGTTVPFTRRECGYSGVRGSDRVVVVPAIAARTPLKVFHVFRPIC